MAEKEKKIRKFARRVKKTVFLEDDAILWKSEIEGNKLVTNVMIFLVILLIGTYAATLAGITRLLSGITGSITI